MTLLRSCLALGAALCLSTASHAVTLNFNNLPAGTEITQGAGKLVTESGFSVSNDCVSGGCFFVWGPLDAYYNFGYNADPTGNTLNVNQPMSTTTVAQTNGGVFSLQSMDMADIFNEGGAACVLQACPQVSFTFNYAAGGSSSRVVTLDALKGLQTFTFAQAGLRSFSWTNTDPLLGNGASQFDNIVVTSAVPEPASLALMLAGVAALGTVARRRRQA